MKILMCGAHFTPAAATVQELKKFKDIEVVYAGRKTTQEGDSTASQESRVLPSLGVKFIPITAGRVQRSFTIYTIPSLLKIPIGFLHALFIIIKEKPDVILSFGGYVSVPVVIMGWLFSIPIMIHEQTLVAGIANKIGSVFADKIAVSFEGTAKGNKVFLCGNPVRREILNAKNYSSKNPLPLVLITGGNQGSHAINLAVEESLPELIKIAKVVHVTGESKFKDFERLKKKESENYTVKKWIGEEWAELLCKADLVVSRAGINTLSELSFLGKPALIVPLPYLFNDEQNKNAKYFENLGLAEILPQSRLSGQSLFLKIKLMLSRLTGLKEKAKSAKKIIIPDAAKRLALETYLLAKDSAKNNTVAL